jgi:GNAT superfamily N-acetyltransferase
MADILTRFETADVVSAIAANMEAYWMNYGRTSLGELYNGSDCTWFSTAIPSPLYNGVLRTQFASDSINASIDQTLNHFAQNQLPLVWWTTPLTQPATLETSLEAQGLTKIMELPGMAIDLHTFSAAPSSEHLDILTVQDAETLKHWVDVAMVGFDTPAELFDPLFAVESELGMGTTPYRRYLGMWQGRPAAISALYLDAGVAGIYFVATVPQARRQGIGMAVTQAALQDARNLGYRLAILQASPMGAPVYARIGFQEYCKLGLYLWQPGES